MFDKRNRWIITLVMGIAALAFAGVFVVPIFVAAFQNPPTVSTSPSPTSNSEELEAQARGYESVLQREPENQSALRGLIDVRIEQGNLEATVEPLERLAELNPEQSEYQILLAQIYQRLGDREAAAQAYRNILSIRPGDMNALRGLVALLISENRPEAAIALLQDTLQTANEANRVQAGSVDISSVQILLAQIYAEEGRFEEAIAVYDQSIEASNNQDFRPLFGKAIVLQAQGDDEEAQPLFSSAVELAPSQFKDQIEQIASGAIPNPLVAPEPELSPDPEEGVGAPPEASPAPDAESEAEE